VASLGVKSCLIEEVCWQALIDLCLSRYPRRRRAGSKPRAGSTIAAGDTGKTCSQARQVHCSERREFSGMRPQLWARRQGLETCSPWDVPDFSVSTFCLLTPAAPPMDGMPGMATPTGVDPAIVGQHDVGPAGSLACASSRHGMMGWATGDRVC